MATSMPPAGEAMFSVFSLTSSMFNLAFRTYYDLHCEMRFPWALTQYDAGF